MRLTKVIMQGKVFQRCTHLLYCSALSVGGNVNTRRMPKPDMGSIFVNYQNYQNLLLLTLLDTKRAIMHLFLFKNSAHRELISICTQSIRNCNKLSLHYNLAYNELKSFNLYIIYFLR